MTHKYTPGPWTRVKDSWWIAAQTGQPICMIERGLTDKKEADANECLIAAAPELLAACEAALNDRMFKDWPQVATLLMNAIAKAKGKA